MVSRAQYLGLSDSDTQVSASRQRAAGVQGGGGPEGRTGELSHTTPRACHQPQAGRVVLPVESHLFQSKECRAQLGSGDR